MISKEKVNHIANLAKLDIKDIKLNYEINVDIDKAGTAFKEVK